MKRHWLCFLSLLTLSVVLWTLLRPGRLQARHGPTSLSGGLKSPSFEEVHDPLLTSSAVRWQQGLPSHWRACLLQR